jgi:hypothetical protein
MAWITLYITGKPDFKEEVQHQLERSDISFLPGTDSDENLFLVWVDETLPLRDLKKAIGSKIVFKYRLQFFTSLTQHKSEHKKESLTPREKAMIREMKAWEGNYLHSA